MVRINLIDPKKLADQHLIAEYNEALMLLGYVKKNPRPTGIPESYRLGKGHIKFFSNKLKYLEKRHAELKKEMLLRGFSPRKTINLNEFHRSLHNDWKPTRKDIILIKKRLEEKIRKKPEWYRYYGVNKDLDFFLDLLKK